MAGNNPNPVAVGFEAAAGTTTVSSSNPLPVTLTSGATDQDVNLVGINGVAPVTGSGTATAALRVELPTNGTGVVGLNAGSAVVGKVGIDQTTPGTTNAVGFALNNPALLTKATVNISTATTTTVVSLTASNTIRVYKMLLNFSAAQTLNIISSGGTSLCGAPMTFGVGGGMVLDMDGDAWFTTVAGESLQFVTTTTGVVTGVVYYVKST